MCSYHLTYEHMNLNNDDNKQSFFVTLVACFVTFKVDLNNCFYCHHCWDSYAYSWRV